MKRTILVAVLLAGFSALVWSANLSVPSDGARYFKEGSYTKPSYEAYLKRLDETVKSGTCDLVFIGDSITQGWLDKNILPIWEKSFSRYSPFNMGVGGDGVRDVLFRLENKDLAKLKPKAVVLMIGTNDYLYEPKDIAEGVKTIVAKLRALWPDARVVLMSITPRKKPERWAPLVKVNEITSKLADGKSVFYVDLAAKMPPLGDTHKGLSDDCHFNADGYQLWADALAPVLSKVMDADKGKKGR